MRRMYRGFEIEARRYNRDDVSSEIAVSVRYRGFRVLRENDSCGADVPTVYAGLKERLDGAVENGAVPRLNRWIAFGGNGDPSVLL